MTVWNTDELFGLIQNRGSCHYFKITLVLVNPFNVLYTFLLFVNVDQRLDLNKLGPNDNDTVRGQIVGKRR